MIRVLCLLLIILQKGYVAQAEEVSHEKKLLVLVIASNDKPAYRQLERLWRTYANSDPEHVEVYFLKANPFLSVPEIKDNTITTVTEDGYRPGIFNKTILSLEALRSRIDEFDYILRTNLSSFYYFPALFRFLDQLPKEKCYCAMQMYLPADWNPQYGYIPYGSGAGFILSPDMAKLMMDEKESVVQATRDLPDDVAIGYFFYQKKIPLIAASRVDFPSMAEWKAQADVLPKEAYHFRAKPHFDFRQAGENFEDEVMIIKELIFRFYGISSSS